MPKSLKATKSLPAHTRSTRSRVREFKSILRVVRNVNADEANFKHICEISVNDRISRQNTTVGKSEQFCVDNSYLFSMSNLEIVVNRTDGKRSVVSKNRNKNNLSIIDITNGNDTLDCVNLEEDDEVLEVPVSINDRTTIVIEDNDPPHISTSSYIPLDANSNSKTNVSQVNLKNEKQACHLRRDISIISIDDSLCDEDNDIIFVKEVQNSSNILKVNSQKKVSKSSSSMNSYKSRKRKVQMNGVNVKKQKRYRKKNRFNKATVNAVLKNLSSLYTKRCVKCLNLSSNLADKCDCQATNSLVGINPIHNTSESPKRARSSFQHGGVANQSVSGNSPVIAPLSCNFIGNNVYNANKIRRTGLREIIIDGSNVAMGHANGRGFSVKGLHIAIDYFLQKGHKVTAFVPQYRHKQNQSSDSKLLNALAKKGYVVYTPSRQINGKRITPYDDRYIIQYATACEGIVVSSDNYRDLLLEKPEWRTTIERRLLMPTWVGDMLMFPEDPLGRCGPNLTTFLSFPV